MNLSELLALSTDGMTAEELAAHIEAINAASLALVEDGNVDDATLELLDQAATVCETIRADLEAAETAANERAAAAAAAIERIAGPDDGEEADPEIEAEGETPDVEAESEAEVEVEAEPEAEVEAPQAVAAAGTPAQRISRVAARRPAAAAPRPTLSTPDLSSMPLVASANVAGFSAGAPIDNLDSLALALSAGIKSARNYNGPSVTVPIATSSHTFAAEHTLGADPEHNERRLSAVRDGVRREGSLPALAAAGGACAPYDIRYDQPIAGVNSRPVRDTMLNRIGADRGGVTVLPTLRLDQVDGAVNFWDDDNGHVLDDRGTTTKPVLEVDCEGPVDADTYDVVTILQFGNYQARYFRERVEAIMNLVSVAAARKSEIKLLTKFGAACKQVTSGELLGASRDILATLDRGIAGYRSRYRLDPATPLALGFPFWMYDVMRADLVREAPGSTDERLAVADMQINAFFAARKINPKPFLDGESGQIFGPQEDGSLQGWPSTVVTYLYPDGDAHFLDGGELNLGVVRDSKLNGTNKFQVFSETSEGFLYHGATDPLRIVIDICPSGATSASVSIKPCEEGS